MTDSLRSHLEASAFLVQRLDDSPPGLAALNLLVGHIESMRVILDEAEQVGKGTLFPGGDFTPTHRLVPDPVGVVSPRPNQPQETP